MATKKTKIEFAAGPTEMRDILARLGKALETGVLDFTDTPVDVSDFSTVKLTIKRDEDGCRVAVRIKHDSPAESGTDDSSGLPKYKSLKKSMKKPWKDLLEVAAAGQLPDSALLREFLDDCELMMSFPDEGEEYYAAFKATMQDVQAAAASGDAEAFSQALGRMDVVKKQCHDEYK